MQDFLSIGCPSHTKYTIQCNNVNLANGEKGAKFYSVIVTDKHFGFKKIGNSTLDQMIKRPHLFIGLLCVLVLVLIGLAWLKWENYRVVPLSNFQLPKPYPNLRMQFHDRLTKDFINYDYPKLSSSTRSYRLILGSFRELRNAKLERKRLKPIVGEIFIVQTTINNRVMWRLHSDVIRSRNFLDVLRIKLSRKGVYDVIVRSFGSATDQVKNQNSEE